MTLLQVRGPVRMGWGSTYIDEVRSILRPSKLNNEMRINKSSMWYDYVFCLHLPSTINSKQLQNPPAAIPPTLMMSRKNASFPLALLSLPLGVSVHSDGQGDW